jgi:hypothetical protein
MSFNKKLIQDAIKNSLDEDTRRDLMGTSEFSDDALDRTLSGIIGEKPQLAFSTGIRLSETCSQIEQELIARNKR